MSVKTTAKLATRTVGWWLPEGNQPQFGEEAFREALVSVDEPLAIVDVEGRQAVGAGGRVMLGGGEAPDSSAHPVLGHCPALSPQDLGDEGFRQAHGLRYAYVAGAMANGIASESIVEEMAREGMLGFYGSAGLPLTQVEAAIDRLQQHLGELPFGSNLIHSPNEPALEKGVVDLYLRKGVRRISASAYLALTLPLVRYRVAGIHRDSTGRVVAPNQVFAKVSRVEVAQKFFSPPPEKMLTALVQEGTITAEQAGLAATLPVAEDLTAEADSGGHTDNRPALTLVPTLVALRDELQGQYGEDRPLRVGAAGGISTPVSAVAAFSMGAAYILTGSVNQACGESGTSDLVREMLLKARQADVTMAPAADMFEMGVQVQVLKWGTMFPVRARKLYEIYRAYDSMDALPAAERQTLERDYFRCPLEQEWENTRKFFEERDPPQIARAEREPKHKMALVFRSYLGRSSGWANAGIVDRKVDFQVWCGSAMGAFNEWTRGSFLEKLENRQVVTVAHNLLLGAAYLSRLNILRCQAVQLPLALHRFAPIEPGLIRELLSR